MNREELARRLDSEGFRRDAYRLDGSSPPFDGLVLTEVHGKWKVEYFDERGGQTPYGVFDTESSACHRLYELLAASSTAKQR